MAAWNSNSDHFQINCTGSGKDFQLQDGATLVNITPSASGPAFPTNFATYSIGANSFVYLNSPDGVGQTLFSLPSYGNLVFGNRKSVISDGLNDLRCNGYFNMYRSSYSDGGKDIYLAGTPNCITNYSPSTSARKLVLNGASQVIYDYDADPANQDNKLLLANVEFSNSGTKTLGDGNDTIAITQSLKVASGVTVTCNRPIDFYGNAWTDDGDFQHSSNTLSFSNTSPLIIKPGRNNHFFNTITFNSAGAKTFVTRGADINGSIILNAGTVDFGSLTHKIAGNVSNTAGDVASSSTDFIFDGNGQSLQFMNGSTFSAHDVNITTAATTNQTKVMGS